MATKNIDIIIRAKDDATKELKGVKQSLGDVEKSTSGTSSAVAKLRENWVGVAAVAAGAGVALHSLLGIMGDSVTSANKMQAAFTGLNTVARAFGQDANKAEEAARALASDGLMTVTDSARGLKNLLASGFSLDQAVILMNRFKDSAAFGRQSALSFGDAIASATEGIKNGNSILVDNAGVTKNLSMMLEEAGYSSQDLMKATTDSGVRQAIFGGILKETNAQLGDAERLADSAAGKQAMMAAETENLKARIGESLQPALLKLLEALTPMIEKFAKFTEDHPNIVAAIAIIGATALALITTLGTLGLMVAGLGPIFTAMGATSSLAMSGTTAAVGATRAAVGGLSSFVGSAAAAGPWGVLAAAAIAAAALVIYKWQESKAAVEAATESIRINNKILDETNRKYEKMVASGEMALGHLYKLQQQYGGRQTVTKQTINGMTTYLPTYAEGTDFHPGGKAIVGEKGPELVDLPRGARVMPAGETAELLGDRQNNVTLNNVFNVYNQTDLDAGIREIGWRLARI